MDARQARAVIGELIHKGKEMLLRHKMGRSGWDMDHPDSSREANDRGQVDRVPSGNDIDLKPLKRKAFRKFRHVEVLATTIDAAERPEWRGVLTNH
jgi:hypothetical protein